MLKPSRFLVFGFILFTACAHEPIRKTHTPYQEIPSETQNTTIKKIQSLYSQGKYLEAMKLVQTTPEKKLHPNDLAEFHNLKGLIYLAQKNPALAEISFRNAIQLNHVDSFKGYFQYNLATAYADGKKTSESLALIHQIDLDEVDPQQKKKILLLKERLTQAQAPVQPKETPKITEVTGQPSSAPTEVYSGSVNKKRIGLLIPLSGKYDSFGKKVQRSVELAFQHSTDSRAKEYEILAEDSGETPESRVAALKKLVETHEVIAVIGPIVSKGIEELATQAAFYQVPLISLAQAQGVTSPQLFSCAISNRDQVSQVVDYAMRAKGFTRFAILAPKNKPGNEMTSAFQEEVVSRTGEIVATEYYEPTSTDFRTSVDKILGLHDTKARAAELKALAEKRKELNITKKTMKTAQYFNLPPIINFDAVFIADEAKTVGQIIPTFAYRDAPSIPFLGITSWNSPQLIQRAQEQVEGAVFPVAFNTLTPSTSTQAFYDLYGSTYSTYPNELDALAFDAAMIVLKTLNNSPSSRDEFKSELERPLNFEGATGSVTLQNHQCQRKLDLVTVQKGKFTRLTTEAPQE